MCNELSVPVAFALGEVAVHDVIAYLLDEHGALARVYRVELPEIEQLLEDVDNLKTEVERPQMKHR
jgi:hypothetical protein